MSAPIFEVPVSTGRDLDPRVLARQIGANLFAISGGRISTLGPSTAQLPAGAGYYVVVTLEANDTYTVRRVYYRGAKCFLHGERTEVFCDEVSEVCYYASCFRSYDADEWVTKS